MPARGRLSERGSGTILAAGLGLLVIGLLSAALLLAQAAVQAQRAAAAADLAALAAADAARGLTPGDPCTVAAETAAQNNATLTSCQLPGGGIAEVRTRLLQGSVAGTATGHSRAGPPP
ncbi:helicase/secretion neighborhood TadE-like protein [Arthrobacter cupressi]|uniref:Helicase/secretion neighborhood TadE-like protein n=2 Tax=Arthrobacter cupressi TaxID=1045773 RepID=A0A1G8KEU6_9MICC|nr:Rv3654c family TadE-like protein [Arthrobacter cupressi]SDI41937.1 helicase/secretion neighborhood TadE-like protein [Arthrobacter cupressi]